MFAGRYWHISGSQYLFYLFIEGEAIAPEGDEGDIER